MKESISCVEVNIRSQIILALLEDYKLHERPDLVEHLKFLTHIFYECRDKYIKFGDDEICANERAMEDIKLYVLADAEPESESKALDRLLEEPESEAGTDKGAEDDSQMPDDTRW